MINSFIFRARRYIFPEIYLCFTYNIYIIYRYVLYNVYTYFICIMSVLCSKINGKVMYVKSNWPIYSILRTILRAHHFIIPKILDVYACGYITMLYDESIIFYVVQDATMLSFPPTISKSLPNFYPYKYMYLRTFIQNMYEYCIILFCPYTDKTWVVILKSYIYTK